jgi:hypothetical protein
MNEFIEFPKIPRFSRDCILTEKIDGTNGCIRISLLDYPAFNVGSRSRWITPSNDNHGFAKWAYENETELFKLGPGLHFGEWWGQGINRGYGLKEKRFSLFNVTRWDEGMFERFKIGAWQRDGCKLPKPEFKPPPACCHVVPVIAVGVFGWDVVSLALSALEGSGSYAAPGFMKPEGVVIYHTAGNCLFKKTIEKDDEPKSKPPQAALRAAIKQFEEGVLRG